MITAIAIALSIRSNLNEGTQASTSLPKGSEIFSKMLVHYHDAQFGSGRIQWTQSSGRASKSLTTDLCYERINKLYLLQSSPDIKPGRWLTVCDGLTVSFDAPPTIKRLYTDAKRLLYPTAINGRTIRLPEVLSLSRASLGDAFNPFFIVLFASEDSNSALREYVTRIRKVTTNKAVTFEDNAKGYQISGIIQLGSNVDGRFSDAGDPVSDIKENLASFEMEITETGDLRRVQYVETYLGLQGTNKVTEVKTVWEGKINITEKPNTKLFEIPSDI